MIKATTHPQFNFTMKLLASICVALIALHCYLGGLQQDRSSSGGVDAWPVANPEVVNLIK